MTTGVRVPDQLVTCDTCKQEFAQQANSFVECEGDVETVGLECPHCGTQFVAHRINEAIRNLQAKVRRETEKFRSKIAAGVAPNRAERKLRQAKRQLERAFKAFNETKGPNENR